MRSGRSRTIKNEAMAELIIKMIASKLKAATLWSVRAIFSATPNPRRHRCAGLTWRGCCARA
jgi:hypothetical protein